MVEVKKIKKSDTKPWMEGGELCRIVHKTDKLMFGYSFMNPGTKGNIDKGHDGEEVFWVAKGYLLLYLPEQNEYYEAEEGEALVVPPGVPHMFFNPSDKVSIITYALSPP